MISATIAQANTRGRPLFCRVSAAVAGNLLHSTLGVLTRSFRTAAVLLVCKLTQLV